MAGDGQVVFTVEMDDTAFQQGMEKLQTALTALGENAVSALKLGTGATLEALAAGRQWIGSLAQGMGSNTAAQTAARRSVTLAATAARGVASSGGQSVGRSLVAGIAAGVSSGSGAVAAAVTAAVQRALGAARRAAGINSPSRLFRDEVGHYLAMGVQTGFEGTLEASVLPAIARGIGRSAQAGKTGLQNTLVGSVQGLLAAQMGTPALAAMGSTVLAQTVLQMPMAASAHTEPTAVTVNQHITFEAAMQAPDEVARAIRRQATYGLAGARA